MLGRVTSLVKTAEGGGGLPCEVRGQRGGGREVLPEQPYRYEHVKVTEPNLDWRAHGIVGPVKDQHVWPNGSWSPVRPPSALEGFRHPLCLAGRPPFFLKHLFVHWNDAL